MSLRRKALLTAGATLVVVTAVLFASTHVIVAALRQRPPNPLIGVVLVAAGMALGMLALGFLLERLFLARWTRLSAAVARIATAEGPEKRAPVEGDDELAGVARALNRILDELERQSDERRRTEEELACWRSYYLTVLDELPALYRRFSAEGECDHCSRRWLSFTGRTLAQEMGNGWLEGVHPEDRARVQETVHAALAARQPYELEYRLRRQDGQHRWVIDTGTPLHDLDGQWSCGLSSCHDITDRRRLEEQFRQAQKMEALGRLAGGIAHDFNNLLTAITGYASFARDALHPESPVREDIAQVLATAGRASGLTRQLLAFSRREAVRPAVTSLNDIILNLGQMLRHLISEEIELQIVPAPELGAVRVDPGQIEQVLVNLVVNAADAMPEGGRVTLETALVVLDGEYCRQHLGVSEGEFAMLAVSDNGSGMSDEVKARIFEPFFTTKKPGQGTGLGLATCYALVRQNGGHIAFYSEAGQGTTFKIYFPLIGSAPEATAALEEELGPAPAAQTVLLVEDDSAVRSFAARALCQGGYTVLEAASGAEALALAAERDGEPIHLLIADVVMPQMGGKELARRLQAAHAGVRTLFISGYTANVLAHNGALDATSPMLQKPFAMATLLQQVREVLRTAPPG